VDMKFGVGRAHNYGARWYDAAIGRFTSVDPLASDYAFQSPYASNNLRIRKLHLIRTEYRGVKLLTPTNKIIQGTKVY